MTTGNFIQAFFVIIYFLKITCISASGYRDKREPSGEAFEAGLKYRREFHMELGFIGQNTKIVSFFPGC